MNFKKKAVLVTVVLAAVLTGAAVADLLLTKEISTTMQVKPEVSMDVYDVDGVTPLTSITLGQFPLNSLFYFPGHLADVPSEYYFINNTDQQSFYIAFDVSDCPPNVGFEFWVKRGDKTEWARIGPSISSIYQFPIESSLINPDPATQHAVFYFRVWVATQAFGTYTPKILIIAYDSPTG